MSTKLLAEGEPAGWGGGGDGEEKWLRTIAFDSSRPHPMTDGLPPDVWSLATPLP